MPAGRMLEAGKLPAGTAGKVARAWHARECLTAVFPLIPDSGTRVGGYGGNLKEALPLTTHPCVLGLVGEMVVAPVVAVPGTLETLVIRCRQRRPPSVAEVDALV